MHEFSISSWHLQRDWRSITSQVNIRSEILYTCCNRRPSMVPPKRHNDQCYAHVKRKFDFDIVDQLTVHISAKQRSSKVVLHTLVFESQCHIGNAYLCESCLK